MGLGEGTEGDLRARVESVLARLRAQIQDDGGDVALESLDGDGVVTLRVRGCTACPVAIVALIAGLEAHIRQEIPAVSRVEARVEKLSVEACAELKRR